MLFNSFQYWIFFLIVATLFYSVPFRIGKFLLLGASYIFYMWWDPRFIVLILTSTVVDYFLGILLETTSGRTKKLLLVVSLVVNLGILGFFKYYDFFASSLAGLLRVPESSVVLQVILPVGVSFYTFASLSYTIDVYWGKMKAVRNFVDYALFIAFFPHLIAGPIIRARHFISQIQYWRRPAAIMVQSGIILVLAGLIKKMVFADRFAVVSDAYFNDPAASRTTLADVIRNRYFVPFRIGLMFLSCTVSMAFFRPRTLQASGYVLSALFGFQHVTGDFLLTTGTIVLIFISLFLAVAQERTQFIDRLALQPARVQVPVYVCAFLALELFPATGQVPFVYFQF